MICLRVSPQTPLGVSLKNVELVLFPRKILYQAPLDRAHEGKVTCDLYTLDGRACFPNSKFQHRPPLIHPPSWKQDFPVVFLPFPFPSPPAPAARVTRRRLGTSQLLALVAPHNALTHKLFILQDRYADSKAVPPVDDQQDYELTDFQESDGKTLLKFKRKFDTCDPRDRKLEVSISAHHFLLNEMPPQVYRCYSSALHFPPSFQPFLSHSHYS